MVSWIIYKSDCMTATDSNTLDYSIVICAYNPDIRILTRCLQAVSNLDREELRTEVILVDNNSDTPLLEQQNITAFEQKIPGLKIIRVVKQGVKYARMAAIAESLGKYIVYIDYDNEPGPDYLQELKKLNANYPSVTSWGPGEVTVEFVDGIDKQLEDYARIAFQEKHAQVIGFDNKEEWQTCYPVGTGLCTNSFILKEYVTEAEQGRFSLPGRKGNQLSSGEDTQMILLSISKGFFAGNSPTLRLKHLISKSRANIPYLRRLAFGTAACYETCLLEVFPNHREALTTKLLTPATFTRRAMREFIKTGFGLHTLKTINLIHWMGLKAGSYYALHQPLPRFVQWLIKFLKAE
jgi:glycosyltransferase involved in cell wall biosynthesis